MNLKVKRLNARAEMPKRAHADDACFDIKVLVDAGDNRPTYWLRGKECEYEVESDHGVCVGECRKAVTIPPYGMVVLHTGLAFEVPQGYVMKVHVRSSVGIKQGLMLSNGTGIIDSGYRGELHVALTNASCDWVMVYDGATVAQAEICEVLPVEIVEVDELSDSERGTGGIGSTGK